MDTETDQIDMTNLATFVKQKMDSERLSSYDVARRSDNAISQSNINRVARGEVRNPAPEKLKALARGLGVPYDTLLNVAYQDEHDLDDPTIPAIIDYCAALPQPVREDVLEIVKALHRKYAT